MGVKKVLVLGDSAVMASSVEATLRSTVGRTVLRLAGHDRYETARKVAEYGVSGAGLGWDNVAIATGAPGPKTWANYRRGDGNSSPRTSFRKVTTISELRRARWEQACLEERGRDARREAAGGRPGRGPPAHSERNEQQRGGQGPGHPA